MKDNANKKEVKKIKVSSAETPVVYNSKETENNVYRVVCLSVIGIILVGVGIALVVVGDLNDIQDSIIVGAIFMGAGVIFVIMIFAAVTRPNRYTRNKVSSRDDDSPEDDANTIDYSKGYLRNQDVEVENPDIVFKKNRPSEVNLYGHYGDEKLKIHIPEPEVVYDVSVPRPIVTFPNTHNPAEVTRGPVFNMTLRESTNLEHV